MQSMLSRYQGLIQLVENTRVTEPTILSNNTMLQRKNIWILNLLPLRVIAKFNVLVNLLEDNVSFINMMLHLHTVSIEKVIKYKQVYP